MPDVHRNRRRTGRGRRGWSPGATPRALTLRGPRVTDGARHGDSIAVNGVCLTVVTTEHDTFTADVMPETLHRSSLGALSAGSRVNLERPMALGGRLGGHLVQGHVDGTGTIAERTPGEHWELVRVTMPAALARYVVEKGSITVDGISPDRRRSRRGGLHRQPDPHHPGPDDPGQAGGRPGQPRGRRARQVRRAACCGTRRRFGGRPVTPRAPCTGSTARPSPSSASTSYGRDMIGNTIGLSPSRSAGGARC